jgi:hypothetical protein
MDYYRYTTFTGGDSSTKRPLATGVTGAGLIGVWTTGMANDVELELMLPFESVRVNDDDAAFCMVDRPKDFCTSTFGLGEVSANIKWRVVNELYSSPVSVSVNGGLRSGEAYAGRRNRLTTLGDGQTDLGAGLAIGRTATLGRGWYTAVAEGRYWYRFPNATPDSGKIPADEVSWVTEAMLSVHPRFSFGPAIYGYHKLGGIDLEDIDFYSINSWSSLQGEQIKVGAKFGLYSDGKGPTVSVTVLRAVTSKNNPADLTSVSFGLGFYRPRPAPAEEPDTTE